MSLHSVEVRLLINMFADISLNSSDIAALVTRQTQRDPTKETPVFVTNLLKIPAFLSVKAVPPTEASLPPLPPSLLLATEAAHMHTAWTNACAEMLTGCMFSHCRCQMYFTHLITQHAESTHSYGEYKTLFKMLKEYQITAMAYKTQALDTEIKQS